MRPGLGGDARIAERYDRRADFGLNVAYPNFTVIQHMSFEITEAGQYKVGMSYNVQAPGNNANNEFSAILRIDHQILRPRSNTGMFNNTVPSRDHVQREYLVTLAEGTHHLTSEAFTVGTDALVLAVYFVDGLRLWVDRL